MTRCSAMALSPVKKSSKWPRWPRTCLKAANCIILKSYEKVIRAGRRSLTNGTCRSDSQKQGAEAASFQSNWWDLSPEEASNNFDFSLCAPFVAPTLSEARVKPMDSDSALDGKCLFNGWQGSVYEIQCQSFDGTWQDAVMKVPRVSPVCVMDKSEIGHCQRYASTGNDQLWLVSQCDDDKDFFYLSNRALGDQVLEIQNPKPGGACALAMAQRNGSDRQKWQVDSKSRLVSKLRFDDAHDASSSSGVGGLCLDVSGACTDNAATVVAYAFNEGENQQWELHWVSKPQRLTRIISRLTGNRALALQGGDQVRRDMGLEVSYLARWSDEPGLVQLQRLIWNGGTAKAIVLERLGKQLGRGTGKDDEACILRDIRDGLRKYTVAEAARSLIPVAHVLFRLHLEGYAYNDLHDGNILQRNGRDSYKLIDLGAVTSDNHWVKELGPEYDARWCRNRDWRAFAVAFLGLLSGGKQLNIWDLVGTNACTKAQGGFRCPWSEPTSSWSQGTLPPEVNTLLAEPSAAWTRTDKINVFALLEAIFAHRVNDYDVCTKLNQVVASACGF
eukprot:TRINITY_DN32146_c0_g1_i1.p1 TRINITY_DN32146_c0_g1~~TRINITY_DN32146_c0_g1_i1.p1  ORF type:complete len:559 (-),score=66.26 TRINITY_DN32146_c0_g1_i1:30-1706(-)